MAKRVFIVEDEADVLEFYVEAVELLGHVVAGCARNGADAVSLFAAMSERPDVILMDHRMPIKNGLDASREILRIDPEAKIILASADQSIEKDARKLGAVAFKKRPFSLDRLLRNIEKIPQAARVP